DIVRIDLAVKHKKFGSTPNIKASFDHAKAGNGRIHFLGLVSDGGVHSHIAHLFHLLESAKEAGVPHAYVHFFGDGRDTSPKSSTKYLRELIDEIKKIGYGELATIVGRYYAMDRDKRWERVGKAVDGLVRGEGEKSHDAIKIVEERYEAGETDEFLKPIILSEEGRIKDGTALRQNLIAYPEHAAYSFDQVPNHAQCSPPTDGDTLFFFNFRSDRMREIASAFGIKPPPFETEIPKDLHITSMTQYKSDFPFPVAFPPQTMDNVLAEWLAKNEVPQVHVAETEKYAHVTFFFNGGTEAQFPLEERCMIASPKVATYDLQPAMSAQEVADKVAEEIASGKYPFVMCNFAPPDMVSFEMGFDGVGHTGVYEAAIKGVEATGKSHFTLPTPFIQLYCTEFPFLIPEIFLPPDAAIGTISEACKSHDYVLFVTADHGNAEKMLSDDFSTPHTAHTTAPVPFVMASHSHKFVDAKVGALCDVAPTVLRVMGIDVPEEMTGVSLLQE
ncbi:2,3-bisphosphoglycerate-independent phosphoglycerate mutase, partial [Jimgerdemannia flammicorona]